MNTVDIFKKCAPAVRTNIGQCGTVSLCESTVPSAADELDTIYKDSGDWRILEALLMTQMETKACGAVQNSWEDFFLANVRTVKRSDMRFDEQTKALTKIRPFLLSKQRTPINNNYWRVSGGTSAGGGNWRVDLASPTGIPADTRSFAAGERLYIESRTSGGSKNWWSGVVVSASIVSNKVRVVLTPQNDGTAFAAVENPVTGLAKRGSVNIGKSEAFCDNEPGYLDTRLTPYWIEHTKFTLCSSDLYNEFRTFVVQNNPLYATLYDLPEVEENRQRTKAFWSKWFNNLMFGTPISGNQNENDYRSLETIDIFTSSNSSFGVEGGRCSGFKANTIGWMEQLQTCGRIYDAQGGTVNLWSIMNAIYEMMRVRMGVGSAAAHTFDVFTDGDTAHLLERGFIALFKDISQDTMRLNMEAGSNKAFGFNYRSFKLVGKCSGITLNIITHTGLDDYLAEWNEIGEPDSGRMLWFLDMTGIYAKVLESTSKSGTTGKWDDLVKIDPGYQCVEETYTKTVDQRGVTYAAVVECPASSLIIYNFAGEVPLYDTTAMNNAPDYTLQGAAYNY